VWRDRTLPHWEVRKDLGNGLVEVFIPGVAGIDAVFGGHLHVVLNPPKLVIDPDGRTVPVVHSGAFAKFLGRFDMVVNDDPEQGGKRIVASKYQVFPVDNRLAAHEDAAINEMLEPYALDLHRNLDLRRVIGYAPVTITRFSRQGNGDSALGNLVAASMQRRRRVNAEFAVTNTLGIRDNLYAGPITLEDMFNVFPFENTLTVMYLSSPEVQELADYMTFRSASRGCNAQAQVSGMTLTMNCAQVLVNDASAAKFRSPAEEITINGRLLTPGNTYKLATNDYIAHGGSGFRVLKRNTTQQDTHVSLRDALIDHMKQQGSCGAYEFDEGRHCLGLDDFSQAICRDVVECRAACRTGEGIVAVPTVCGGSGVTPEVGCDGDLACVGERSIRGPFSQSPCIVGVEDGRIRRKVSEGLDALADPHNDEGPE
jgi:2',3'-cyclic-nucleotide 2'-phosphodiesterase (5'-nucleotidase family)